MTIEEFIKELETFPKNLEIGDFELPMGNNVMMIYKDGHLSKTILHFQTQGVSLNPDGSFSMDIKFK